MSEDRWETLKDYFQNIEENGTNSVIFIHFLLQVMKDIEDKNIIRLVERGRIQFKKETRALLDRKRRENCDHQWNPNLDILYCKKCGETG